MQNRCAQFANFLFSTQTMERSPQRFTTVHREIRTATAGSLGHRLFLAIHAYATVRISKNSCVGCTFEYGPRLFRAQ